MVDLMSLDPSMSKSSRTTGGTVYGLDEASDNLGDDGQCQLE
jgi:hypothetical protein